MSARPFGSTELRAAVFSLLDQQPGLQHNARELRRAVEKHMGWTVGMDEVAGHRRAWLLDLITQRQNAVKDAVESVTRPVTQLAVVEQPKPQEEEAPMAEETKSEEKKNGSSHHHRKDRDDFIELAIRSGHIIPTGDPKYWSKHALEALRLHLIDEGWDDHASRRLADGTCGIIGSGKFKGQVYKPSKLATGDLLASLKRLYAQGRLKRERAKVKTAPRPRVAAKTAKVTTVDDGTIVTPGNRDVVVNVIDDRTGLVLALVDAGAKVRVLPDGTIEVQR